MTRASRVQRPAPAHASDATVARAADEPVAVTPSTAFDGTSVIAALAAPSGGGVARKENNTGLPDTLKSGIENLSGYGMDDVKVHINSAKPAQLNALAYAQGKEIHFAPDAEKQLPHEAWHVVQQAEGRVVPK